MKKIYFNALEYDKEICCEKNHNFGTFVCRKERVMSSIYTSEPF